MHRVRDYEQQETIHGSRATENFAWFSKYWFNEICRVAFNTDSQIALF